MKNFSLILTLAIISGALAGIIASVITNQSLERYAQSLADSERLFTISEEKPQPLPGTYEEALSKVQETGWPTVAFVRPISSDSLRSADWVTADSATGFGTVVTSDGWILFHEDAVETYEDAVLGAEVWIQGDRFSIKEIVRDVKSDLVLIKIDAGSLSTLAFGPSQDMLGGDVLFVLTSGEEIIPTSLMDAQQAVNGLIMPSETFITEWEIANSISSSGPILNAAGELVGFAQSGKSAVPLHHFQTFIQSTLRHGEATYAGVGIYTVSISDVLNLDEAITSETTFGSLVASPDSRTSAVLAGGPADLAEIQEGDVIISIDDVLITENESFAELLSSYEPDQSSTFAILRDGERLEVELTYVNLQELQY